MAFKYELKNYGDTILVQDPIYGEFEVNPPFSKIILTKEMQRLDDIMQTGFSVYDYPGLKNGERLSHSVGAFHVMSQIIERLEEELKRYGITISNDDKDMALCSMLLHDIGHGPFSHNVEGITHYSHEKRTTDILLGDTDVNKILVETYGNSKLKKIASYIAEIDEPEDEKNKSSFSKLLKSLISHQLDADRLDYLVRDSYHAGLPSAISYKTLLDSLSVSVNSNQEYELLIDRKGLTNLETVLIERFQRYRDVYLTRSSILLEKVFAKVLELYKNNPESVNVQISDLFKQLAVNPENIPLDSFLGMTDSVFLESFDKIKENSSNPLLSYLCDFPKVLEEYQDMENGLSRENIIEKLNAIFPDKDLTDSLSVLSVRGKTRLYKKEESLRINMGNRHSDISEVTPYLIRPDGIIENKGVFFNPEILRLELGMSKEEFENYSARISSVIEELNKKPEEFELKYIMDKDKPLSQDEILNTLFENGFSIVRLSNKENNDEYYDTQNFSLLLHGGSLRIRQLTQEGEKRYKATYKMPTSRGEVYSSREEVEMELEEKSIDELKQKMKERGVDIDYDNLYPNPLLNSVTQRRDVVLEKNGIRVCLSFDDTTYTNHLKGENRAIDSMIEIEALGNVGDRVMLNEINEILQNKFPNLQTNKQSKYERGMRKTKRRIRTVEEEVIH